MEAEVLGTGASTEVATTSEGFRVGPFDDPDRYEIGEPVEAGAEGILYRGRLITPTSRLTLSVAVKALQPAYAARIDQWAARWRDQVELLRSLQIPGLVGVREGFVGPLPHRQGRDTAGRNLYLVMNWVEGEALDHWVLRHREVDVSNALKLLLPVAVAVDTMHGGQLTGSVPVVHRDIKPANILIGKGGSVLVDFGLTKGLSVGHPVGRAGTPGYIAPEVLAGGGYTPAADRYAFGATVFFLLTGRHPSAATDLAELRRLLESAPVGGGVSPELVERVVAMLDPDPARRPGALANWIAQLRQSSLDDEVLTVRLAPPAPARPRRTLGGNSGNPHAPAPALSGGVGVDRSAGTATNALGAASSSASATVGAATSVSSVSSLTSLAGSGTATDSGTAASTDGLAAETSAVSLGFDPHRRGGAHRAPHRAPQHIRRPRTRTSRYSLAALLAVALMFVASDTGALARAPRQVAASALGTASHPAGGSTTPSSRPSGSGGATPGNAVDGRGALAFAPEVSEQNGKVATAPTTTPSPASCVKSLAPNCGPLVWSPPIVNRALNISFSYAPQHPSPGQLVTFKVVLDDPDDINVQLTGLYFGDGASPGGNPASPPANSTGPACQAPHGTWPAPAPRGHGHRELTETHTYTQPGSYQVHFTASSGTDNGSCAAPDPYANTAMGQSQTLIVNPPPPAPTTTTSTTVAPPPDTTTTTPAPPSSPQNA